MKSIFRRFLTISLVIIHVVFIGHILAGQSAVKGGPPVPANFCITADEMDLYRMINGYRKNNGLEPIPLSKSLCYVAAVHTKDLLLNHSEAGACNFHSWSNKGFWTPFCYPGDESKKKSVWDKPGELTKYPSKAYEIVYWENNPLVKDTIIMVWKMEDYFNSFLLSRGKWQGKTWNAIGISVYENWASAWFGEAADPEGEAFTCGSQVSRNDEKPPVKPADTISGRQKFPEPAKDSLAPVYHIIVKTNLSRDASNKLANSLKSNGYPDARVLENDGKIRVSAFESADKAIVTVKLKEVKKTYRDAWLLKR